MKRTVHVIMLFLFSVFFLMCSDGFTEKGIRISFLRTELGGCHNQDSMEIIRATNDYAPYYSGTSMFLDTLDIVLGLKYNCCALFETEVLISNDTIFMYLEDTCDYPEESCYCRCICWYTWDFYFIDYQDHEYVYKMILIDPREENPIVVGEGSFRIGD